ncbi:MAG TPA: glycosyltransferase family 1 protein [Chitinophagaceae bacterium]|jgi:glycosyltransferase involved in cell wall biosynthesis|nr:glycosyltransferase family 1 protein [Chitinophagaceae bacterium]
MKIGIDAKWLFTGHISGKLFIQNILPELFILHPEIEWHLFLDKKDKHFKIAFKKENIKIHYVWAKYNMVSNLFVLPKYAKLLGLDVVLFQTFSPKGRSFKSVVFIHDILFKNYPEYFTWKERLYFKPIKWTARYADRIITTTNFVKNELIRFHYAGATQPIDLAPSGVTGVFKPRDQQNETYLKKIEEKYGLPNSFILFAGRLNARKNIQGLIRSLSLLNDQNIALVIVGNKDWKVPEIHHLLSNNEERKRIIFTGSISDEELAAIHSMARVFCFPSFAEGFGLPPLEAMACGVPVIVSNTTSMPEVCGNVALFINPHDPKDIAKKINELLQNSNLYQQKVKEGLMWSSQYTWKRTAEGIMKSILAAIEDNKKRIIG